MGSSSTTPGAGAETSKTSTGGHSDKIRALKSTKKVWDDTVAAERAIITKHGDPDGSHTAALQVAAAQAQALDRDINRLVALSTLEGDQSEYTRSRWRSLFI